MNPVNVVCGQYIQFFNVQARCIWLLVCFKGVENGYGPIGLAKDRVFLWFCENNELSGFIND
jgi:hypothetical protein